MNKLILILISFFLILGVQLIAQTDVNARAEKRSSLTVGVLQGGGSLVGADFETLISKKVGIQIGAGFIGYGAALNYHFKPSIRSSYLSLMYWHQGAGAAYTQSIIGPNLVFRGKRWFTAQIGLGFTVGKGPAFPSSITQPPMMLMYSIGAYFPL